MAKYILENIIKQLDNNKNYSLNDLQSLLTTNYNNYNNMYNENNYDDIYNNKLCVFTDGACINNGKPNAKAGYSVIFPYLPHLNYSDKLSNNHTNNRAEYMAVIKAIEIINNYDKSCKNKLYIYTDSELLVKSITKWIKLWKKNGWKTSKNSDVLNKDLLIILDDLLQTRNIEFIHVEAHTNKNDWISKWNNIADIEAKKTIKTKKTNILEQFSL
jgi:ribonuclease HI